LTTFNPSLTLSDFDAYALLPKSEYNNFSITQNNFPISIPEENKLTITWNSVEYILVSFSSNLSSGTTLTNLKINK